MTQELQDRLHRQYGLTEAEAAVGVAVARGQRLSHIAEGRGVSIHTVRNQLKNTLIKTGCHRQSELILLVSTMRNGT